MTLQSERARSKMNPTGNHSETNERRSMRERASQIMVPVVQTVARDINKEAMLTNAKLFVAMGLTWIGEFVTGLYERNSAACVKDPDTCVHPTVKMVVNCMNIF